MALAQKSEISTLWDVPFFTGLPENDLQGFTKAARIRDYKKNEYIYYQGDEADRFFIVIDGWVRLYRETIDGDESVSSMLTKKDIFGEGIIFYQSNSYIFSAQAIDHARVFEISKTVLRNRAEENPEILKRIMSSVCDKMIKLEAENERLAHMNTAQRTACLLLRLSAHMVGNGGTFTFPYDKNLAAAQLGMKRETFSRSLASLKPLGITVNGSEIRIENFKRLTEFSCKQCTLTPDQCAGARFCPRGESNVHSLLAKNNNLAKGNHSFHGA